MVRTWQRWWYYFTELPVLYKWSLLYVTSAYRAVGACPVHIQCFPRGPAKNDLKGKPSYKGSAKWSSFCGSTFVFWFQATVSQDFDYREHRCILLGQPESTVATPEQFFALMLRRLNKTTQVTIDCLKSAHNSDFINFCIILNFSCKVIAFHVIGTTAIFNLN
jgi:hypothetical protein